MAIDSLGGVYVSPVVIQSGFSIFSVTIAKLSPTGSGILWQRAVNISGVIDFNAPVLSVDSTGRSYVASADSSGKSFLARVDATGSAIDFKLSLPGTPSSIVTSAATGAAFAAGIAGSGVYLTKVTSDGSISFNSTYSIFPIRLPAAALDSNGDIVLEEGGKFQRFDSAGNLILTSDHSGWAFRDQPQGTLDAAGNLYIAGGTNGLYAVRNTIATCGTQMFGVFVRDGSAVQVSYIPGLQNVSAQPLLTVATDGSVYLVAFPSGGYAPSRNGPFGAANGNAGPVLIHLIQNPAAPTLALACAGNAASFLAQPVAPGALVTLYGNGLGPQTGVQTQASLQTPFPKQAGNVRVTFDGTAVPILYAQDAQINVAAPWSLTPGTSTRICVFFNEAPTNCLTWPVAQTAPGVFTVDGIHAAALNQDGSINTASNPAAVGSIVSIYLTGMGPIEPAQADGTLVGTPLPANVYGSEVDMPLDGPPTTGVTVVSLQQMYSGPAPGLIAGATQINFVFAPTAGKTVKSLATGQSTQAFELYVK